MNKKDGRQQDGHRLGWVSAPMWARMQAYCEAFAISANDLTVRAIDSFLLEWEEEIVEDDMKIITSPVTPMPDNARDAYEVAKERGITVQEAALQQQQEGWQFVGYNDCGLAAYVPQKKESK